ncbi:MAG: poly-gamma-glutamate synthase PgsB [Candidatus Aminicenantales bacterium]
MSQRRRNTIREITLPTVCALLFILYLLIERFSIGRKLRRIPLRICVAGTRGKSSVTRFIASCLREKGLCVLAKTTGSRPTLILPDGSEEELKRRGLPSILEQKSLLQHAIRLGADVLVCEVMSIRPESGCAETIQIVQPKIIAFTNIRLDHMAQMGSSKEKMAEVFASWIPDGSTVFIPEKECFPVFLKVSRASKSALIRVSEEAFGKISALAKEFPFFEWRENISLALAVAEHLGVERNRALQGMARSNPDFGSLKIWKVDWSAPPCSLECVSCFSANEPESTGEALSFLEERKFFDGKTVLGLLNLRKDRGDRTLQWLRAVRDGAAFPVFRKIFLAGLHARAFRRKLRGTKRDDVVVLKSRSPEGIMSQILKEEEGRCVVVGMGNIGGTGRDLVSYWERVGKACDV